MNKKNKNGYDVKCYNLPKEFKTPGDFHSHLINKIKNNNENKEEYLDILFRNTYKYIYKQLMKYSNIDGVDELMPYASMSFMKAVESYKVESETPFLAFYKVCLKNEIYGAYFHRKYVKGKYIYIRKNDNISLDFNYAQDNDGRENNLTNILIDNNCNTEEEFAINQVINNLDTFINEMKASELSKKIIKTHITHNLNGEKVTYEEIAKSLGISKSYVTRVIDKMKDKIKTNFIYKNI